MQTLLSTPPRKVIRASNRPDYTVRWLASIASLISVIGFVLVSASRSTMIYKDSISHLEIARRIVDSPLSSPNDGLGQLGGVWLPLPHLLAIPFVWFDPFYESGFAGAVISMVSFVITTVLLYKLTNSLTGSRRAGIVTAVVFMTNPSVLYMQSTPMTELLLFACMVGMVYGVQRWIQTMDFKADYQLHNKYLIGAAIAATLGSLSRYEAWILMAALFIVVVIVLAVRRPGYKEVEGSLIALLVIGGIGVVLWLGWNMMIFQNPLYFQFGEYSKPSLWVNTDEVAIGNFWISLQTYFFAVVANLTPVVVGMSAVGLVIMVVKERLALKTLPTLSLLTLFPFFVAALQLGQRPLHVMEVHGDIYNIRFGLMMILPAAIIIGYLVSLFSKAKAVEIGAMILVTGISASILFLHVAGYEKVAVMQGVEVVPYDRMVEGDFFSDSFAASQFLSESYSEGLILEESFGNERLLFDAAIKPSSVIYEGSYRLWEPALSDPAGNDISWIIMRGGDLPDVTYTSLANSSALNGYELVFQNNSYMIYKENQ